MFIVTESLPAILRVHTLPRYISSTSLSAWTMVSVLYSDVVSTTDVRNPNSSLIHGISTSLAALALNPYLQVSINLDEINTLFSEHI